MQGKEPTTKKAKHDLVKVKYFNCDNHGHLAKDYLKPLQVNDFISQGKKILQGGLVVEIRIEENEASNLLKLRCKVNNEFVCCLLDSRATNLFITLQVVERLEIKTKLMVDPITMHLAQGISRPSFIVALSVELFCRGIQFFENFTLCDLDNFDVILRNMFLDVYEINIFYNGNKVRVCAKVGFKLMNLDVEYNFMLVEVRINLVVLAKELKLPSFVILMSLRIF